MKYRPIHIRLLCLTLLLTTVSGAWAQKPSKRPDLGPDLFMAAGKNDLAKVQALLKRGADPNARNFLSFTPLIFTAMCGHEAIAKTLLAHGAELEAKSPFGTALTFALEGAHPGMIRFLLARNANVAAARFDGITTLMLAATNGDAGILRLLLSKNAKINAQDKDGETALMYAARAGQINAARLLIEVGATLSLADSQQWTALTYAIANGHPDLVTLLVEKGADVNHKDSAGRTPLMIAALYGRQSGVIRTLLAQGADPQAKDAQGRTALLLARARGSEECVQALRESETTSPATETAIPTITPRVAVTRGLALLERTNTTFAKKAGCVSCHHEGLGLMATASVRERGFTIDTAFAQETMKRVYAQYSAVFPMVKKALTDPETAKHLPGVEISELTPGLAFMLSGLVSYRYPADATLAAVAQVLAREQAEDGHWGFILPRVPVQSSHFTITALSLRILQAYMPDEQAAETTRRIARAREWLLQTPAQETEDRTFRLLGLKWAGASLEARQNAIAELRALQRSDGGWAQQPSLRSDAYATGEALYALREAGEVSISDPAWQRGLRFLLQTQDEDGSWYVNKRAIPANNFLDVGFPHGESQYISYAATCWAVMALAQAEAPTQSAARIEIH